MFLEIAARRIDNFYSRHCVADCAACRVSAAHVYCLPSLSNMAVFSCCFTAVAARHVASHELRSGEHVTLD